MKKEDLRRARCIAHPEREAAAACRGCGQPWCRECVSEYRDAIYCRGCLPAAMGGTSAEGWKVTAASLAAGVGGVLLLTLVAGLALELMSSTAVQHVIHLAYVH